MSRLISLSSTSKSLVTVPVSGETRNHFQGVLHQFRAAQARGLPFGSHLLAARARIKCAKCGWGNAVIDKMHGPVAENKIRTLSVETVNLIAIRAIDRPRPVADN